MVLDLVLRVPGIDPASIPYDEKILTYAPILFLKGNETSGVRALDSSGAAAGSRNGTYINNTLDADTFLTGDPVATWNGTNAYLNLMRTNGGTGDASTLGTAFGYQEGSALFWFKPASGFWSGTAFKYMLQLRTDNNNRVIIFKQNAANTLRFHHVAGGTLKAYNHTFATDSEWIPFAMTWKVADGGLMQGYVNGVAVGSPMTGLGTWVGTLDAASTNMGAQDNFGFFSAGSFAYLQLYDYALTANQIADLSEV